MPHKRQILHLLIGLVVLPLVTQAQGNPEAYNYEIPEGRALNLPAREPGVRRVFIPNTRREEFERIWGNPGDPRVRGSLGVDLPTDIYESRMAHRLVGIEPVLIHGEEVGRIAHFRPITVPLDFSRQQFLELRGQGLLGTEMQLDIAESRRIHPAIRLRSLQMAPLRVLSIAALLLPIVRLRDAIHADSDPEIYDSSGH